MKKETKIAKVKKTLSHYTLRKMIFVGSGADVCQVELDDGRTVWITWGNNHETSESKIDGVEHVAIENCPTFEHVVDDSIMKELMELHSWSKLS